MLKLPTITSRHHQIRKDLELERNLTNCISKTLPYTKNTTQQKRKHSPNHIRTSILGFQLTLSQTISICKNTRAMTCNTNTCNIQAQTILPLTFLLLHI